MNTRNTLQSVLGLRGLFPPFFTRTVMTAVLIAPALWAHVETQIIAVADPEGAKSKPPDVPGQYPPWTGWHKSPIRCCHVAAITIMLAFQ